MYDYEKFEMAFRKFILDFQPDMYVNLHGLIPLGATLEILDYQPLKWPGHGMDSRLSYQYVEGEYMKAEEYDEFFSDPSAYMARWSPLQCCLPCRGFTIIIRPFPVWPS